MGERVERWMVAVRQRAVLGREYWGERVAECSTERGAAEVLGYATDRWSRSERSRPGLSHPPREPRCLALAARELPAPRHRRPVCRGAAAPPDRRSEACPVWSRPAPRSPGLCGRPLPSA